MVISLYDTTDIISSFEDNMVDVKGILSSV